MPVYGSTIYTKSGNYKIKYQKSNQKLTVEYYTSKTYKTEQQFNEAVQKLQETNKYNVGEVKTLGINTYVYVNKK
jgi:hypothetical protein